MTRGSRLGSVATIWAIQLLTSAAVFSLLFRAAVVEWGVAKSGEWGVGTPMDPGLIAFFLVPCLPLAALESWTAAAGRWRWLGRASALVSAAILACGSAFPVVLRFAGDVAPIERGYVGMAGTNYVIFLLGFALMWWACYRFWRSRLRFRRED